MTDQPVSDATEMTIANALRSALECAMAADEKVVLLGEDIADPIGGVYKVTKGLSTRFGSQRVRATPIAEQAIVGAAVGLALGGYRPVAEVMFIDFVTLAMDQLVNHAAKFRYMSGGATPVPLTVRTTVGNPRFGAQHSQSLEAWFMHVPGLKVIMPSSPADAKGLLASCIFDDDPCLFIEHSGLVFSRKGPVPAGEYRIPLGQASVLRRGTDATLITYGPQVPGCLEAAAKLDDAGISAEVIDLRTLVPLDLPTILESVSQTRRAVIVHDATQFCGPGAEISSQIHEQLFGDLLGPVLRLGAPFAPAAFAQNLPGLPTAEKILNAVTRLLSLAA